MINKVFDGDYLVHISPWPLVTSTSILMLATGVVMYFQGYFGSVLWLLVGFLLLLSMFGGAIEQFELVSLFIVGFNSFNKSFLTSTLVLLLVCSLFILSRRGVYYRLFIYLVVILMLFLVGLAFSDLFFDFIGHFFLIGKVTSSGKKEGDKKGDSQEKVAGEGSDGVEFIDPELLQDFEAKAARQRGEKTLKVDSIESFLSTFEVSEEVLLRAKEFHKFCSEPCTIDFLRDAGHLVLEDKVILDILLAYIDHFGSFNVNSSGDVESITLLVPKSERFFLLSLSLYEDLGTWVGIRLVSRGGDIDDLLYEFRIDFNSGLQAVTNKLKCTGLLGYGLNDKCLEVCNRNGWIVNTSDIGKLSDSRLYGLLNVILDVEQYAHDFGLVFSLIGAGSDVSVTDDDLKDRHNAIYDVLMDFIGVDCSRDDCPKDSSYGLRIFGKKGFELFYAKWGKFLMGGAFDMCDCLHMFYDRVDLIERKDRSVTTGTWKPTVEDAWLTAVKGIELVRFKGYRVPRETRMEVIKYTLAQDFIYLPVDFNCRSLASVYNLVRVGAKIELERNWGVLQVEDDAKFGVAISSPRTVSLHSMLSDKEFMESRSDSDREFFVGALKVLIEGKVDYDSLQRFKFNLEKDYMDWYKLSCVNPERVDYKVCYLSPTYRTKLPYYNHQPLGNYYVGTKGSNENSSKK